MTTAATDVQEVSITEAVQALAAQQAVLIDVRTPEEYHAGHIARAQLIPLEQLPRRWNEVPKDKTVHMICHSGARSTRAVQLLKEKGFTNAYSVKGGMLAWTGPIEK